MRWVSLREWQRGIAGVGASRASLRATPHPQVRRSAPIGDGIAANGVRRPGSPSTSAAAGAVCVAGRAVPWPGGERGGGGPEVASGVGAGINARCAGLKPGSACCRVCRNDWFSSDSSLWRSRIGSQRSLNLRSKISGNSETKDSSSAWWRRATSNSCWVRLKRKCADWSCILLDCNSSRAT